jgi:hypothetical protein
VGGKVRSSVSVDSATAVTEVITMKEVVMAAAEAAAHMVYGNTGRGSVGVGNDDLTMAAAMVKTE